MTPLTVHNAEIRTASVEIRTLTVSGKQVTLAVFRQLQEEALVAPDGTFNGEPWGVVNYHPDKCGNDDDHVHVVWQRGAELRRSWSAAPTRAPNDPAYPQSEVTARYLDGLIVRGLTLATPLHHLSSWVTLDLQSLGRVSFEMIDDEQKAALGAPIRQFGEQFGARHVAEGRAKIEARHEPLSEEDVASFKAEVVVERERRQRLADRWVEIEALPQLFIAV